MRISVKGRYALAAVTKVAGSAQTGENVAVISISGALGISKIYLEQVFAQLKKAGLLLSVKGSRGGYQLSRPPAQITAWDVLAALETALVEQVEDTVSASAPEIELGMQQLVFGPLDVAVQHCLSQVTVQDLLDFSQGQKSEQAFMIHM